MENQKDQARSSNLFDQLIDQYKLEAHISQTAITDLYRAFDVDENRAVAVEILLPTFNNKKQYVERFIEKMNKVAQLKHPNIAQVHQIGLTPNDRPYVARDLVEGITLRERLRQLSKQPTPSNSIYALKIIRQLAEALELAERLELYHYHLSPDNIMLKQDGTVILVDLGIPAANNGTAVNMSPALNLAYVAPEQAQGKEIDSRSQIYSLGVILHELLSGELPDEPRSIWQTLLQAFKGQSSSLAGNRPDLAPQTLNLIEKSLRLQPWGRYNNIKEFLEAVNEALQNERMQAQSQGESTLSPLPLGQRPRTLIMLPLVVLALGISAIAIWAVVQNQANQETPQQPLAISDTVINSPTPTLVNTTVPVVAEEEPTPLPVISTNNIIDLQAPAAAAEFQAGDTASFQWSWSSLLEENQRFSVYLLSATGRSLLGSINTAASDGNYSLQALLPETGSNAMSEWHVILEDTITNREVATSANWPISIKPAPITPTFTPSPTVTPTPTNSATPTPIPQVEVFVSSASVREGPGTIYTIIRFLFEGEVVAVLAKDSPEGEWYNVLLDDGTRGWLAASVSRPIDENSILTVPIAATIPPRPTSTPTPTPTNTPIPTETPVSGPSGGDNPTTVPPTFTPPPPPPGG